MIHVHHQRLGFSSDGDRILLGQAVILNAFFLDGKWSVLLNFNEQILEMESDSPPEANEVELFVKPTDLVWLKD